MLSVDIVSLEKDMKAEIDGEVRFDAAARALFASDSSNYRQPPIGVVIPRSTEAVEKTIAVCRKYSAPLVSRGAGTSLGGQACNFAVVIDFSKYLNNILEIDPQKKIARVQPGAILDHLCNETERKHRLTFGPDPATHSSCTFGGMIGNNSCGVHSLTAGRTSDNIQELEILTYDGLRMRVGQASEEEFTKIVSEGGRRADIYLRLRALRERHVNVIRDRYPKIPLRTSGYNLDELLEENGFNIARALVGTESTCAIVLEATLKLIHSPPGRNLLVLGYPDIYTTGDQISEIKELNPIGCDGFDEQLVQLMQRRYPGGEYLKLLPEGKGWLIVEFGGETPEEAEGQARRAMAALGKSRGSPAMRLYQDTRDVRTLSKIREAGISLRANMPGILLSWPGWEDAAVPPESLGNYLREFRNLLNEFHYSASLFGHFGQGGVNCRISFDFFSSEGVGSYMQFIDKASDLVVKYNGSFSAGNGDGQSRSVFLQKMFGGEIMDAFREFKSIWDPEWRMNPGKLIEPYTPDKDLRFDTHYQLWDLSPTTHFKFSDDQGSFSRAALRCVGAGKCREMRDAFMCPSFLATREEQHTTRGRTRLLFEMFKGDLIKDGWKSREVFEAFDLCLSCKGCKKECPANVDMATYKSEFLSHFYEWRPRPRSHYAMGLIGYWGPLAAKVPTIANLLLQTSFLNNFIKLAAGIDRKRSMPRFMPATFSASFAKKGKVRGSGEKVLLIPDLYNDCFYPQTLSAAADVLSRWGFDVVLPKKSPREIRPLLQYGMLTFSKYEIRRALKILRRYAIDGMPVIFLEPSSASVYRDDMTGLFLHDEDGLKIRKATYLFSEFVEERKLDLPKLEGRVVFHGHCHQKAVLNMDSSRKLIAGMGLKLEEPEQGCCGMAGAFGFEDRHYDLSIKIGEEKLLPAVRDAKLTTYVVADGFSCRSQIMQSTRRRPLHTAELLQQAFQANDRR